MGMSDLYRPNPKLLMGPLTGIRPDDNRWGGELVEPVVMAIYDDVVNNDIPLMLKDISEDMDVFDIVGMAVIQTIVRTAQRIAVELDGCVIDTTTIFDEDLKLDE